MRAYRVVLVAFAATTLKGCIYVPVKSPVYPSSVVGPSGSNAPLRVGTSTRAEIISRVGKPTYSTEHSLAIGYMLSATVGRASGLLLGMCSTPYFGTSDKTETDDLWLEFDERSILKRFVVHRKVPDKDQESWLLFCVPVPDKPREDQLLFFDQPDLPYYVPH